MQGAGSAPARGLQVASPWHVCGTARNGRGLVLISSGAFELYAFDSGTGEMLPVIHFSQPGIIEKTSLIHKPIVRQSCVTESYLSLQPPKSRSGLPNDRLASL